MLRWCPETGSLDLLNPKTHSFHSDDHSDSTQVTTVWSPIAQRTKGTQDWEIKMVPSMMMVNFMCQPDCPHIWWDIISGCVCKGVSKWDYKSVDWVKQRTLPNVSISRSVEGLTRKTRLTNKHSSLASLMNLTLVVSGLRTQTELRPLALLGLMGLFSLHNHMSPFNRTNLYFYLLGLFHFDLFISNQFCSLENSNTSTKISSFQHPMFSNWSLKPFIYPFSLLVIKIRGAGVASVS